jgi:hypothetical protein
MRGPAVVLGDAIVRNDRDIRKHFGQATVQALHHFHRRCTELCSPEDYYEGHWQDDNSHPWAKRTFRDVLDEIPDDAARKYVEVAVRSDIRHRAAPDQRAQRVEERADGRPALPAAVFHRGGHRATD